MDWNKLKFTKLENEILEFLFRNPTNKYTGKQLSKKLKASQTAISKTTKNLSKNGLLHIKKNILLSISLNRNNKEIFILKRIFNLKEMYTSGLIKTLSEEYPGSTIILFGSYSYGEDTENSDIDIAIIGYEEKPIDIKKTEKKLQRKIHLHFFKKTNEIHKDLKENIINGILLEGGIKL